MPLNGQAIVFIDVACENIYKAICDKMVEAGAIKSTSRTLIFPQSKQEVLNSIDDLVEDLSEGDCISVIQESESGSFSTLIVPQKTAGGVKVG